jgi:hypothetical protein
MERMGHRSTRAALVYLHSTSQRQHAIADAVSKHAKAALRKAKADKAATETNDAAAGLPASHLARKWHVAAARRAKSRRSGFPKLR